MKFTMKKSPKCYIDQEPTPDESHHEEKSQMYTDQEPTPDEPHHEEKSQIYTDQELISR